MLLKEEMKSSDVSLTALISRSTLIQVTESFKRTLSFGRLSKISATPINETSAASNCRHIGILTLWNAFWEKERQSNVVIEGPSQKLRGRIQWDYLSLRLTPHFGGHNRSFAVLEAHPCGGVHCCRGHFVERGGNWRKGRPKVTKKATEFVQIQIRW